IKHITGIAHSPTGQAIVEQEHQTLKSLLLKQKGGEVLPPAKRLAKALYVLNFLRLARDRNEPPMVIHGLAMKSGVTDNKTEKILVQYKDLNTGQWKGP
ncbi:POK6 protein, partial [Amazona guildingii]|nr:POK6 protein [Amazona guildingii]